MKLNVQYFYPGKHHLCMFCNAPIAVLTPEGGLRPMGNKAHVLLEKTNPGLYIINCCCDCADRVDFKDEKILKAIRFNVVKNAEFLDYLNGITSNTIQIRKNRLSDTPFKTGFIRRELSGHDRVKNIKDYKDSINAS